MSQFSVVFLGSEEYQIPVLFSSARAWVERELAPLEIPVCDELSQVASEQVLLIGAACPEVCTEQYQKLMETHLAVGADLTVLSGRGSERGINRGSEGEIVSLFGGSGSAALPVVCARTEVVRGRDMTDLLHAVNELLGEERSAETVTIDHVVAVTNPAAAFQAQKRLCKRINYAHIAAGVQIFDPENVYIAADAVIGAGTVILPGTIIRGGCTVGCGCTVGPNTILEQAAVGDRTSVNSSQIYESRVGSDATVGPFAYIRPGCTVGDHTRIGDFVELKKSSIGNGTKVSHLTYIGDAKVGERVNFGCGTVIVNYDGYKKYQTVIGDDCFIGCNTNLVSPVELGDRVFTAAGTTVTENVPDGALTIARARQTNLEGWNDKRREKMGKK